MYNAFKYFNKWVDNKYPMLESDYPYTSGSNGDDSTDCLYSATKTIKV